MPGNCATALACGAAIAQKLDPSRVQPITAPLRSAGTIDLATGAWTRHPAGALQLFVP